MKQNLLRKIYIDELRNLYNSDHQLVKALVKLAKAGTSPAVREGFEALIGQTQEHVARLAKIFEALAESPKGKPFTGMEGLIKEADAIAEDLEPAELDVRLIFAAQRLEHYEMAGYRCVHTYAMLLGENEAASLLKQTLNEEKGVDARLTDLAETIIIEAMALENATAAEKALRKYLKKSASV
jgi:ferritin-like metal-binding protein YciE